MRGLFFTGTDTEVGKTFVTSAVAKWLCDQGRSVQVTKPVATGASWIEGQWLSEDTHHLAQAIGASLSEATYRQITPWSFEPPVAPSVAARQAGTPLSVDALAAHVLDLRQTDNVVLVEGVGGLLCPLTESETIADLAQRLAFPVVVVTRRSLGTLNHTLLTLEVAQARGLQVVGLVMSETSLPQSLAERTNVEELMRRTSIPLLAVVPWQSTTDTSVPPALAQVDWWSLAVLS